MSSQCDWCQRGIPSSEGHECGKDVCTAFLLWEQSSSSYQCLCNSLSTTPKSGDQCVSFEPCIQCGNGGRLRSFVTSRPSKHIEPPGWREVYQNQGAMTDVLVQVTWGEKLRNEQCTFIQECSRLWIRPSQRVWY